MPIDTTKVLIFQVEAKVAIVNGIMSLSSYVFQCLCQLLLVVLSYFNPPEHLQACDL